MHFIRALTRRPGPKQNLHHQSASRQSRKPPGWNRNPPSAGRNLYEFGGIPPRKNVNTIEHKWNITWSNSWKQPSITKLKSENGLLLNIVKSGQKESHYTQETIPLNTKPTSTFCKPNKRVMQKREHFHMLLNIAHDICIISFSSLQLFKLVVSPSSGSWQSVTKLKEAWLCFGIVALLNSTIYPIYPRSQATSQWCGLRQVVGPELRQQISPASRHADRWIILLVSGNPTLWKILVSLDDEIPNTWKMKKCSKTRQNIILF